MLLWRRWESRYKHGEISPVRHVSSRTVGSGSGGHLGTARVERKQELDTAGQLPRHTCEEAIVYFGHPGEARHVGRTRDHREPLASTHRGA
jgi:hypothetical protein